MRRSARVWGVALAVAVGGCASPADRGDGAVPREPTASLPSGDQDAFPTQVFAELDESPIAKESATQLQAALRSMAGKGGMSATVMSADGMWSGAVGKADGVRDVGVDDQFAIASATKPVVAAQVLQMVEAGELALDDPAVTHLPADLDFDSNGATVRQLLSHRSGIPDYYEAPEVQRSLSAERRRAWTPAELLGLVPAGRAPAGTSFEYADTNYLLIGLLVEQVRGRPIAEVLRAGVLDIDGVERLIYQPGEKPTAPMAMPDGGPTAEHEKGGGFLPSLAGSTSDGPGAAMASDARSLARWWRAFCAGEIVSAASVREMSTFDEGYGLGLLDVAEPYAPSLGHTGNHVGYVAWAGCLPDDGLVVVVLHNRVVSDIGGMAQPLVMSARYL